MDKKYRDRGLILVAPEVQRSSAGDISGFVQKYGVGFTVTQGISGPQLSRSIPSMAVFDVHGDLVFTGHPMSGDAEAAIEKALREVKSGGAAPASSMSITDAFESNDLVSRRTWTDSSGMKVEASLVKVENDAGEFRLVNGKTFEFAIANLSELDQMIVERSLKNQ